MAAIDLSAGRKATASAACSVGNFQRIFRRANGSLLDEDDWGGQFELSFGLWLERAEAEFLTGHFEEAEHLIQELLPRAVSKVDQAAVYNLKVSLHILKLGEPAGGR